MLYSKFNSSLSLSFINQYGNLRSQESKKIKIDSQGNFYVGGTNELAGGGFEFLLVKFNSSGTFQWARGYNNGLNTFQEHLLEDMIIDPNGYIYVTGGSEGTGTMFDITTLKYDLNGNLLWTNRYNGNGNSSDGPYSVDLDSQGNVYVGGVSVEEENPSESANPRNTFIVIKYNPANGNRSWVRYFYGNSLSSRDASCAAVKTDANNNVICTGYANMLSAYDYITIK
ncbi:MAG: hypothetical protein SGI89_11305 [bacterium]|nr:hypothetical protein [bacterium]